MGWSGLMLQHAISRRCQEMGKCLLMLLHPNADLITSTSEQCISQDSLHEYKSMIKLYAGSDLSPHQKTIT